MLPINGDSLKKRRFAHKMAHEKTDRCSSVDRRERRQLEVHLRSTEAFTLRRCQILLTSARAQKAIIIARNTGCSDQTICDVIRAFEACGLAVCIRDRIVRIHPTMPIEMTG